MTDHGRTSGSAPPVSALLDLRGHTALVTGAGAGIGTAIAARLAEAGAAVIVHFHASAEGAATTASAIRASGGVATLAHGDITDARRVEAVFEEAAGLGATPDLLVNNAGTYPLASILDMTPAEWNSMLASNLTSVHLVTQAFARRLRETGRGGAIVNLASIEASTVAPSHAHYAAAKAGVLMYTRSAAREFGPLGIRVNAVSPGLIWRPGLDEAWPDGVARYRAAAALGRLGTFADIADACLFLVSGAARWITGAELVVDGGVLTNRIY